MAGAWPTGAAGRADFALVVMVALLWTGSALAAVSAAPASVSAKPAQTTPPVMLSLSFTPQSIPGTGAITFAGLPPGVSTMPAAVTYTWTGGSSSASTSFSFSITAAAAPGNYTVLAQDATLGAGQATIFLTIQPPTYTMNVAPNPVTLVAGGPPKQTMVNTLAETGFSEGAITYSWSGFPSFVLNDGPKQTTGPGYAPVVFNVSLGAGATGGTFTGTIMGESTSGQTRATPFTVIVQQPDLAASFTQPAMQLCNGAPPAGNNVSLTPLNGYSGTPSVAFTSVPPGISITPVSLPANAMPPGQMLSFTVAATDASAGVHTAMLSVSDPAANINKTIPLMLQVIASDFTASVMPLVLSLTAGGSAQSVSASVTPGSCLPGNVTVAVSGQPAGLSVTPNGGTFSAPGFAPVSFAVQASPSVPPGTYPITFQFSGSGVVRTSMVQVLITAAPDFMLALSPAVLTIAAGSSAMTMVSVTPINGFTGPVSVTAPALPGIMFTPAAFTLSPGVPQAVTVSIGEGSAPGSRQATFTGSSLAPALTRTATLTLQAPQDFAIGVSPSALTIRSGDRGSVLVSATSLQGFTGTISVTAPSAPGLTFTPAVFTLQPGGSQEVAVQASSTAPAPPQTLTFTATAPGIAGPRTAQLLVNVLAPAPVLLAATPPTLVAGSQGIKIRVSGQHVQPGARFFSNDASLIVEGSEVLTPQLADVRLRVTSSATPGPRSLNVSNPDGATAATPLILLVYATSSIAAPLDVTTAAIVFPAQGTMIAMHEALLPRGLLATTGTGTIVGSWLLDGAPFDRFTVQAAGGMPVEVRGRIPIPVSHAGAHTLELVIESPRKVVSPRIEILAAIDRASRLTQLAPRDGAVLRGSSHIFRWSLVPNCGGYIVEVALPAEPPVHEKLEPVLRFRVRDPEWTPAADDLAAIGGGIHRWRVRPVCGGETEGEPTGWRRFALLPEQVSLQLEPLSSERRGGSLVRWRSGIQGLLHRVEVLSSGGAVLFAALTPQSQYVVPADVASDSRAVAVRVAAIAPGGDVLGISSSRPMTRRRDRDIHFARTTLVQDASIQIETLAPVDKSSTTAQPQIVATWKGALSKEQVSLLLDDTDVTPVSTITSTSIAYDPLLALEQGVHTLTLTAGSEVRSWSFTVAAEPTDASVESGRLRTDWVIMPVGTMTVVRDATEQVRTQFSGQTDLAGQSFSTKSAGDISYRHDLDASKTVQESRNWGLDLGAQQGTVRESLRVGFAQPDFFDQAQFLNTGIARGGAQGKVVVPLGSASYYQTFTTTPAGVSSGNFGPEQRIRAAAYETPVHPRWGLRILGMRVDDFPGILSAGGEGEALGVFASYRRGPHFNVTIEGARGSFEPALGSDEASREGNAWRIALDGTLRQSLSYVLNVRKTGADLINPANRGFTPGGVPDRLGGDLSLTRLFGATSVTVQLRRLQDGTGSGPLLVPRTRQTGASLSVVRSLGSRVALSLLGNTTVDKGDALPDLFFPRTDRTSSGGSATLSETFGQFNFSQTLSRQKTTDRVNAFSDQTVSTATLTAGGVVTGALSLFGTLSGTRLEGSEIMGTTDIAMASVQPLISIPPLYLTLQPRATITKSTNDLVSQETTSEQYQALITFAPAWFGSVVSLQVSADWSRTQFEGNPLPAPFQRRYVATLNLLRKLGPTVQ